MASGVGVLLAFTGLHPVGFSLNDSGSLRTRFWRDSGV